MVRSHLTEKQSYPQKLSPFKRHQSDVTLPVARPCACLSRARVQGSMAADDGWRGEVADMSPRRQLASCLLLPYRSHHTRPIIQGSGRGLSPRLLPPSQKVTN